MTVLEVSCTAVAVQNSSQWPCSVCPIPQLRLVGVRTSYIFFSLIFPKHPEFWTPFQIPISPPPPLHPVTLCVSLNYITSVYVQKAKVKTQLQDQKLFPKGDRRELQSIPKTIPIPSGQGEGKRHVH